MPIEINTDLRACDQEEFHALDRRIMRVVFDVHNEFGRLLDEALYKAEIAARCLAIGIEPVDRELRIRVRHQSFTKDYFMDLVFGRNLMLEGKAAEQLVPAHRNQALNYLFFGPIGTQILHMVDPDTSFAVTAVHHRAHGMRHHLDRLLHHTRLRTIQWINFNRHMVEFTTIRSPRSQQALPARNDRIIKTPRARNVRDVKLRRE